MENQGRRPNPNRSHSLSRPPILLNAITTSIFAKGLTIPAFLGDHSGMKLFIRLVLVIFVVALSIKTRAADSAPSREQLDFFEQKIRPLLIERCYKCHADKQAKGGLRLDDRPAWQKGGDTGPALIPGKPDESLLVKAIRYQSDEVKMPPAGRLADAEIALLEEWVRMGAPDPREGISFDQATHVAESSATTHWAYQPLQAAPAPTVQDQSWPLNDVDRFVLAALEQKQLKPSADATRERWLRRATLDLTGLPPTVAEIHAFLSDREEGAFERVIDRLLASSAFGERWARPWLDLVGYADQIGSANNVPADHAWRYRDYVIRAFNADKPWDEFIREQIAGDLLSAQSIPQRQDQLTATGFLVLGNVNIVEGDKLVMQMDLVDQQIEKLGKAFLGMTLNCARCHDHKFDPIPQTDYYGLAGIFASTESTHKTDRGVWSTVTTNQVPETLEQFTRRQSALRVHERKVAATEQEKYAAEARIKELDQAIAAAKDSPNPPAELQKERGELAAKLPQFDNRLWHLKYIEPSVPMVYSVAESEKVGDTRIQVRGNPHTLGAEVPRGFVHAATHGDSPAVDPKQSGRLQLANWLSTSASPLVSRVTVNRVWSRLFGRGIVGSIDYFGVRGEAPTHPELLDSLATRFLSEGMSQKRLIRYLVLSRTYRQASDANEDCRTALSIDPDNHHYWRMSPRRLEAEMIRDSVLAVSGSLEQADGASALASEFIENVGGLNPKDVNPISFSLNKFREEQQRLRTIYLPVVRSSEQRGPGEVLNFFDFPQPAQYVGVRPTTAVASQTLFLLNGPLLKTASQRMAEALLSQAELKTDAERIASLYEKVLNRAATPDEVNAVLAFLALMEETPSDGAAGSPDRAVGWQKLIQSLMASNEFLFRL